MMMAPITNEMRMATRGKTRVLAASPTSRRRAGGREGSPPGSRVARSSLTRGRSSALLPPSGHQETELLVGGLGADLADDSARVQDDYAVGERADLLQLQRDQEYRLALGALLEELAVDELYGAHVHAAGRLGGYDDAGVAVELAREDGLLLVSARERAGSGVRVRGPDVVSAQRLGGAAAHDLREDPTEPGERRLVVGLQGVVLVEGEVLYEPLGPPVFGDVGEAPLLPGVRP